MSFRAHIRDASFHAGMLARSLRAAERAAVKPASARDARRLAREAQQLSSLLRRVL